MPLPPQAYTVMIYPQGEDLMLSDSSDKINEFQLLWSGYLSKSKPVVYNNKNSILSEVTGYLFLNENWDGHGAIPPYLESISNCVKFLNRLPDSVIDNIQLENLVPSNYGTIILELHNSKREKVSLEFGKTKLGFFTRFEDKSNYQINETLFNYNSLPPDLISAVTKLYKSYIF